MKTRLCSAGRILAFTGVGFCVAAVLIRLAGHPYIGGFETVSFFMGGMALLLIACVAALYFDK